MTSNFQSFYIYDMEKPGGDPEIIRLEDLEEEYYRLQFLVDEGNTNLQREMEVSIAAGEIVGFCMMHWRNNMLIRQQSGQ